MININDGVKRAPLESDFCCLATKEEWTLKKLRGYITLMNCLISAKGLGKLEIEWNLNMVNQAVV